MKKEFRSSIIYLAAITFFMTTGCSDNEPSNGNDDDYFVKTIGFKNVPSYLIGGPTTYGSNLYYEAQDQITTGYLVQVYDEVYAQFPINYGETFDAAFNTVWGYSYYNGGLAVSSWHDMDDDSYMNQLSVYSPDSPSGGNFIVAYGNSDKTNPMQSNFSDYDTCGRIYLTDAIGYSVSQPGTENTYLNGKEEEGYFKSVMLANTTYTYLSMKNGNDFASALNEENEGWFKVQFIAFDDNERNERPVGYVEAYLANFDKSLEKEAGFYGKIRDDWFEVDLSSLPEASILVINFVGSDMGEWGLNTPKYCALDNIVISVEKD